VPYFSSMSATLPEHGKSPSPGELQIIAMDSSSKDPKIKSKEQHKNYKGFVAGVFSGVSKLTGQFSSLDSFT
jgi:hypothetical protein